MSTNSQPTKPPDYDTYQRPSGSKMLVGVVLGIGIFLLLMASIFASARIGLIAYAPLVIILLIGVAVYYLRHRQAIQRHRQQEQEIKAHQAEKREQFEHWLEEEEAAKHKS